VLKRSPMLIAALSLVTLLTACGGGGGEDWEAGSYYYDYDFLSYDEYSRSTESYTPPSIQINFFPLAVHFRTITKSYVSKVGTTATRRYKISGTMTTSTVSSGAYEADLTTTVRYQSTVLFEGISATPVAFDNTRYNIKLNGVSQGNENSSSTSYYDSTYGLRLGSLGSGFYKVLDQTNSRSLPDYAVTGDMGDYYIFLVYSNSSKSTLIGRDILSYKILSTSIGPSGQYKARVEYSVRSYSISNQLLGVQTSTDDVVYSTTSGAGSTNVSLYIDDVSGSTTSRLLVTRIQ
jgi:hypothetical protein